MASPPTGYQSKFAQLEHALELRREGRSYREIADRVGLSSEGAAQKLVSRAIKTVLRDTAEEIRSLELSRLEVLVKVLWDPALKDIEGQTPDFRRFDRLKGLLETKLKWCGATAVVEDHSNKSVHITINKYTDATPTPPPPPKQLPSLAQIEEMTETSTKEPEIARS